ncbi:hypothetical protein HD595_000486 [Nonomuraea roseoviolacea subsp. carminata]|uniref:Uncharacterized protein n=1 Tax=Nonomuraea roseoviolacea subsp. carminata TaxID=160689 RepID=A0ABT1JSR2_9ACTN|nr:hypothetical protein [Nonomuraea roseoviolacea subsp. carminata]
MWCASRVTARADLVWRASRVTARAAFFWRGLSQSYDQGLALFSAAALIGAAPKAHRRLARPHATAMRRRPRSAPRSLPSSLHAALAAVPAPRRRPCFAPGSARSPLRAGLGVVPAPRRARRRPCSAPGSARSPLRAGLGVVPALRRARCRPRFTPRSAAPAAGSVGGEARATRAAERLLVPSSPPAQVRPPLRRSRRGRVPRRRHASTCDGVRQNGPAPRSSCAPSPRTSRALRGRPPPSEDVPGRTPVEGDS